MLKKHHCCYPIKPKKPKVTLGIAPVAPKKPEVSPVATCVAEAILKKPVPVEEDTMIGVEPSISADPPNSCSQLSHPLEFVLMRTFLYSSPFPREFDCVKIKAWLVIFNNLGAIVRKAGHTDPDCL